MSFVVSNLMNLELYTHQLQFLNSLFKNDNFCSSHDDCAKDLKVLDLSFIFDVNILKRSILNFYILVYILLIIQCEIYYLTECMSTIMFSMLQQIKQNKNASYLQLIFYIGQDLRIM